MTPTPPAVWGGKQVKFYIRDRHFRWAGGSAMLVTPKMKKARGGESTGFLLHLARPARCREPQ